MTEFGRYAPVLDLPGVADLLGVSIEEARRLVGEGWIAGTSVGDSVVFQRDAVLEWLRNQRVTPPDLGPEVV